MNCLKNSIKKGICLIFTLFISVKYLLLKLFLVILSNLPLRITHNAKKQLFAVGQKTEIKKSQYDEQKKINNQQQQLLLNGCLSSIIDSCFSLLLTATIVNYNQKIVQFTLLICHKVHHSFLSLVTDKVPDYTTQIEQQYSYFLIWSFIVLGFFGISFQISFVIDLVNILTLPTKFIYKFLRILYKYCMEMIGKLYDFVNTNEKKWITCPYSIKIVNTNLRTSAVAILIIIFHLTLFISFYYIWLALVILLLNVLQVLICSYEEFTLEFRYLLPKNQNNNLYINGLQEQTAKKLKIFLTFLLARKCAQNNSRY